MRDVKRCLPRTMLDPNASSIIIGLSFLFCLSLSRTSDSSRQHPTIIGGGEPFTKTCRAFSSFFFGEQHSGLPRIRERETAHENRRLYLSSVQVSRVKYLG